MCVCTRTSSVSASVDSVFPRRSRLMSSLQPPCCSTSTSACTEHSTAQHTGHSTSQHSVSCGQIVLHHATAWHSQVTAAVRTSAACSGLCVPFMQQSALLHAPSSCNHNTWQRAVVLTDTHMHALIANVVGRQIDTCDAAVAAQRVKELQQAAQAMA